jgi:cytosine/adenosine deaminase-related metal-dependent hydrolase
MPADTLTLAARWIFPVESPPLPHAALTIQGERIAWMGPARDRTPDLDLGNTAILPGFVNAHTHLDLPPLEPPHAGSPEDEIAWLGRVVAARRALAAAGETDAVITSSIRYALSAGTTTLADTSASGASWDHLHSAPLRAVVFHELIGLKRERALQTSHQAFEWLASRSAEEQARARLRPGLSPHAPYSTAGWLYQRAADARVPLSTHLAEMPEELQLLESRGGPLRSFLERLDAWDPDWIPLDRSPAQYIRKGKLREADWIVAHATYLDPHAFWQFRPQSAPDGQRVAVAYCPRTHARFGHAPHPFRAMLERGVMVALGTDSRASSPSLSLLDEIRFLHEHHPDLPGPLLLAMATLTGAWALRLDSLTGSLHPGKYADLAIIPLPNQSDPPDPHILLLQSSLPPRATVFQGALSAGSYA